MENAMDQTYRARHERLIKRIAHESEHNGFEVKMSTWGNAIWKEDGQNWCGTAACIGGAAVLLRSEEEDDFNIQFNSIPDDAAEWLGLHTARSAPCGNALFADGFAPAYPTPEECAEAIEAAYGAQDPTFNPWAPIVERRRDQCDLD